ncbi:MAG: ABC transporter ATP-binding protein/permease [Clostridiales bacterium]|jgi:putative ABC transport system permease protein|nr:ABC transporter ATP-binding protein/permease [Clostridiales bacterium]
MLTLKDINKIYKTGSLTQVALRDISVSFRKSEFVSILGHSGSGKTTLLNIIGGLDQYTSGDLIINGKSTKEYNDNDWDTYRNHSVGFVFQNYNLIPHQSVLSNVELALTLSGVSKTERRRRAKEALERVGLADQISKKPNQISGGQMQRVAIARALVNNPDILLADEPTGALDSETSIQIMEILKEISRDRLVIMVTHNSDIAEKYSSRIVRLSDGRITDDSDPYQGDTLPPAEKKAQKKQRSTGDKKKPSMSFTTALALSLNNLMTKKWRTFLTSFAGSIGIIGIALILSVSTGVQYYIDRVQEDTLSSYPVIIEAESVDLTSLLESIGNARRKSDEKKHELDAVYENAVMYEMFNSLNSAQVNENNLTRFKDFLETNEEIQSYLSAIQYSYDIDFNIYTKNEEGSIVNPDIYELFKNSSGMDMSDSSRFSFFSGFKIWEEMLSGKDGEIINETLKSQYEVIAGQWPSSYDEIVLVVDENNEVSDLILYSLGLKSYEEMYDIMLKTQRGEHIDTSNPRSWTYDEILSMTFKLILNFEHYQKNTDGTYTDLSTTETGVEYLFGNDTIGTTLKISGIIRANDDAVSSMMHGSIGYTKALTEYVMDRIRDSEIIQKQLEDRHTDIISGLLFEAANTRTPSDDEKITKIKDYISSLSVDEKASLYTQIESTPTEEYIEKAVSEQLSSIDRAQLESLMIKSYAERMGITDTSSVEAYIESMDDDALYAVAAQGLREAISLSYTEQALARLASISNEALADMLENAAYSREKYISLYDMYMPSEVSQSTYEENLKLLGYASEDSPSSISLFATTFKDKDEIARLITEYNRTVDEEDAISYTDYVALLMSSVTTIINAISYVLIAFVAISLVVSSIMIGIITYISVLERTKEIGILRSIGASKKDIARVFNAETIIVGFGAGLIGIGFTLLLLLPINLILHNLTGINILSARLPVNGAIVLIIISIILTFIAGLIPSGIAAKKNPVEALRVE